MENEGMHILLELEHGEVSDPLLGQGAQMTAQYYPKTFPVAGSEYVQLLRRFL